MWDHGPICPKCKVFDNVEASYQTSDFNYYYCRGCNMTFASKKEKNQMYIIVRDIKDNRELSCPNKVFDTEHQAQVVAEKMAAEHQRTFYVAKLIIRSKPVQNSISERVDS